ncbi:hypothetical protein [Burkholderia mayonis]|uniref:hypothetical protein n=1 Tax=Burkholderia mayonis TaxID=1385591 RepID=UPI001CF791EA|nr:hypothetical protein [Burkholderia mayonis]
MIRSLFLDRQYRTLVAPAKTMPDRAKRRFGSEWSASACRRIVNIWDGEHEKQTDGSALRRTPGALAVSRFVRNRRRCATKRRAVRMPLALRPPPERPAKPCAAARDHGGPALPTPRRSASVLHRPLDLPIMGKLILAVVGGIARLIESDCR